MPGIIEHLNIAGAGGGIDQVTLERVEDVLRGGLLFEQSDDVVLRKIVAFGLQQIAEIVGVIDGAIQVLEWARGASSLDSHARNPRLFDANPAGTGTGVGINADDERAAGRLALGHRRGWQQHRTAAPG